MDEIVLIGYGGHAESVADCIERQGKYKIVGYTDYVQHESKYEYLGTDDVLQKLFLQGINFAAVCIGYLGRGELRDKLFYKLQKIGFQMPVIVDPTAVVSNAARIGEGTFIGKNAVVNAGVDIGKMAIINTGAIIEHDCFIGDFTHISVASVLCGSVHVGSRCLVGANATVLQTIQIGDNSVVGAGTVLAKSIGQGIMIKNKREYVSVTVKH